jgi:hypothetical protein
MADPQAKKQDAPRTTLNQVLWHELQALRPEFCSKVQFTPGVFSAVEGRAGDPALQNNLRDYYQIAAHLGAQDGTDERTAPLSALCFSGGGIRSATFNLGVVQALARSGALGKFDYLSSVSGGGYIASWLRTWIHREGFDSVLAQLTATGVSVDPLEPEPTAVDHLREFSNYLTPKLGLFSGDSWAAAAIVIRNLLLNWLVLIPLLAAFIALPQAFFLFVQGNVTTPVGTVFLWSALAAELFAGISVHWHRRFVREPDRSAARFMYLCVLPIVLAGSLLSAAAVGVNTLWHGKSFQWSFELQNYAGNFALVWSVIIPLIGWAFVELVHMMRAPEEARMPAYRRAFRFEAIAIVISGIVAGAILLGMIKAWLPFFFAHPVLYVVLVLPCLLSVYLLARTLYIALASLSESGSRAVSTGLTNDADREWWARLSGWVLAVAMTWIVATALCLLGQYFLMQLAGWAQTAVAAAGGITGAAAALLASGDKTNASNHAPSMLQKLALGAAAPAFAAIVVMLIAWGTATLGGWILGDPGIFGPDPLLTRLRQALTWSDCAKFLLACFGLGLISLAMARIVNVNRFSLHGFYRNRLVRAYLGASNANRAPDPFTGFDPKDNLRLYELQRADGPQRLMPVINMTLNLVRDSRLAWQQRQAESFSATPYFCGNFYEGYRESRQYGGQGGITVGTAVTISGAAANPNMGYCSSPALAFVMTLFNVRLGAWLGNTNDYGNDTYWLPGPRYALKVMLSELFGSTTRKFKYVSLSDGGHFENLGLYEMVLRRCRYVVVSDAGCDGSDSFEDLGNAIRKIRIDFGIPVAFDKQIEIYPNSDADKVGLYCAVASIDYAAVDGKDVKPGKLLYIKPTLRGRGNPIPYDVYSYSKGSTTFPHEPTSDQWFSESQFESYRMLGEHSVRQVIGDLKADSIPELFGQVENYLQAK